MQQWEPWSDERFRPDDRFRVARQVQLGDSLRVVKIDRRPFDTDSSILPVAAVALSHVDGVTRVCEVVPTGRVRLSTDGYRSLVIGAVLDRVLVEAVLEGVGAVEVSPAVQPYLEGAYEARKVAIGRDGVICHLREVSGSTPKPGTGPRTLATYTSPRASAVRLSADVMRPMKGDAIATFAQPRLLDRHAQALVGAGLRELALTLSGYGMESICFGTPTGWGRLPHLYGIGRRARWRDKRPPSRLIAALDPEVRVYPLDGGSNVITNKRLVTRNLAAVALERSLAGTPDRFRLAKAKVHLDGDRLVLGMPQYVVSPPREERERLLGGALLMARTLGRDRLSFDHLVLGQRNNVADVADWKALVASLGAESNHYGYLSVDVNQGLERLEAVSTGVEAGRSLGDGF